MVYVCVECRNCNEALVLRSLKGGGVREFTGVGEARGELLRMERREAAVHLHNGQIGGKLDMFSQLDCLPTDLLASGVPVTCPHCSRTYLYSSRDAFVSLETDLKHASP